jgi:hypothetical protein
VSVNDELPCQVTTSDHASKVLVLPACTRYHSPNLPATETFNHIVRQDVLKQ